ncbi:MAG: hypothetical protein ABR899_03815 [Candidatus Krumholzibacteriaceae bacterium]|jgi:hypothetical protein
MGKNRIGVLFGIIVFIAAILGCSQEGNLVVKNEGASEFKGTVENTAVIIDPGMSYSTSIYIGKTLAIIGPTDIKVSIEGSSITTRPFRDVIEIKSNETTLYPVKDDVGAVNFSNTYSLAVNQLQIKRCDSTTFGPNLVEANHTIGPGTTTPLQIDPGCWDILVNYGRQGLLDTVESVPVDVGTIIRIAWVPGYVYTPSTSSLARSR